MNDWLIDWMLDWLVDWLFDWLLDWLIGWLVDWLIGWLIACLTDWAGGRTDGGMDGWGWMHGWMNTWTKLSGSLGSMWYYAYKQHHARRALLVFPTQPPLNCNRSLRSALFEVVPEEACCLHVDTWKLLGRQGLSGLHLGDLEVGGTNTRSSNQCKRSAHAFNEGVDLS